MPVIKFKPKTLIISYEIIDKILEEEALKRDKKGAKYIAHEVAWK